MGKGSLSRERFSSSWEMRHAWWKCPPIEEQALRQFLIVRLNGMLLNLECKEPKQKNLLHSEFKLRFEGILR